MAYFKMISKRIHILRTYHYMKIYTFSKIIHRFPTQLNHQQNRTVSSTRENDRNFKDRLQKLKGLFDEGLINVEAYKEAQSDLLKSFIRKVPDILEYKEPLSLLSTKGADWDYQKAPELREILKSWLTEFFDAYKNGKREKKNSPLFTIMGGAGIGKSRLLTELPQIARSAVDNDELKKRLDNALVFNISFENGTAYDPNKDKDPLFAIGTRMLWQLQRRPKMMFPEFQENPKHKLDPNDIIRRIARSKNQNPSDLTVFLLLDGVHRLIENSGDGFNKNSKFYSLLIGMSINIIASKSFIIGCCSTTSMKPMRDALARTSQLHIQLPIPQLKAPSRFHRPVFNMEKPLVKILVEDMGGNGRALEALEEVMPSNIDDSCVIDIIHELLNRLEGVYSDVLDCSGSYKESLRVILSNTPLSIHYPVPGTDLRPDQFAEMGLIRFEAKIVAVGRLTCPYVWLWLMARAVNDPILLNWRFDYYNEIQHIHNHEKIPPSVQSWQNFKRFVADFRVLKSVIYKENVSIHTMHPSSAFDLNKNNGIYFKSKPLDLVCSSDRVSTKSGNVASIMHENGTIDATDGQHLILNSEDAPAGDVFCYIAEETSTGQERNITEVLQLKKHDRKTIILLNEYLEERSKAAGVNDIFLLLTTGKSQIDISQLPARSGIVHQNNWKEYFGPFAGRAFIYANIEPPDINTASRSWLSGIDGIGSKYVDIIIKNRPYQSLEDCHQKTGISHKILKQCNCIINN